MSRRCFWPFGQNRPNWPIAEGPAAAAHLRKRRAAALYIVPFPYNSSSDKLPLSSGPLFSTTLGPQTTVPVRRSSEYLERLCGAETLSRKRCLQQLSEASRYDGLTTKTTLALVELWGHSLADYYQHHRLHSFCIAQSGGKLIRCHLLDRLCYS